MSIPIAMFFKVAPNGLSSLPIFIDIPFMHQMMATCIGTMLIIYFISYIEGNQDDPKGIIITDKLFRTSSQFNLSAISIMLITAFLYAFFW